MAKDPVTQSAISARQGSQAQFFQVLQASSNEDKYQPNLQEILKEMKFQDQIERLLEDDLDYEFLSIPYIGRSGRTRNYATWLQDYKEYLEPITSEPDDYLQKDTVCMDIVNIFNDSTSEQDLFLNISKYFGQNIDHMSNILNVAFVRPSQIVKRLVVSDIYELVSKVSKRAEQLQELNSILLAEIKKMNSLVPVTLDCYIKGLLDICGDVDSSFDATILSAHLDSYFHHIRERKVNSPCDETFQEVIDSIQKHSAQLCALNLNASTLKSSMDESIVAMAGFTSYQQKLTREIKSAWPYPNKYLKRQKLEALNKLVELQNLGVSATNAVDIIRDLYPVAVQKGKMSQRMHDLLNSFQQADSCSSETKRACKVF